MGKEYVVVLFNQSGTIKRTVYFREDYAGAFLMAEGLRKRGYSVKLEVCA